MEGNLNRIVVICLLWRLFVIFCCASSVPGEGYCAGSVFDEERTTHDHRLGHCHDHHGLHDHHHHHHHHHSKITSKIPEELAEDEDEHMELYGSGSKDLSGHQQISGLRLWLSALGCSLLVSLASLICLLLLPIIFIQGKPSKAIVDSLALFGAGAMLGDAFLHQLPHAFGSHSDGHDHEHNHPIQHSHSHSLEDLSVGLSILAGIVLFLLVEKMVRYVEEKSSEGMKLMHGHHHHRHHHHQYRNGNDELKIDTSMNSELLLEPTEDGFVDDREKVIMNGENSSQQSTCQKRNSKVVGKNRKSKPRASDKSTRTSSVDEIEFNKSTSSLVFGYLNLFSDGVHNFTDGMALGSAFLLYGSVGGWSRTLFLLVHEVPQEIGDFGILVRSGFSVYKALCFNFLSALVALAGTVVALLWGQGRGQSSVIEGFTAGGFIYIAVAGVLAEMNNGKTTLKSTVAQLISLMMGMFVALCISLVE